MLEAERGARAALEDSEHRLRLALEASHMGTWDYDVASNHMEWSTEMASVFGVAQDRLGGTLTEGIAHPRQHSNLGQRVGTLERAAEVLARGIVHVRRLTTFIDDDYPARQLVEHRQQLRLGQARRSQRGLHIYASVSTERAGVNFCYIALGAAFVTRRSLRAPMFSPKRTGC